MKLFWILFHILLGANIFCYAQDPFSIAYDIEDGLPTSNVYGVHEDSKGYIWFATDVGVLRYDGYTFKQFNTDNGLGDNEIFKITEDQQGRIWFLSLNGKLSYFKNNKFHNGNTDETISKLSHTAMAIDYYMDTDGTMFFLFIDGNLTSLDEEGIVSRTQQSETPRTYSVWKKDEKLFILNADRLYSADGTEGIFLDERFYEDANYRYTIPNEDTFLFSSRNRVYKYNYNGAYEDYLTLPIPDDIIFMSSIGEDLWIGTRNGVFQYSEGRLSHYFEGEQISGVIKDRQGSIWITSITGGIRFVPNQLISSHELKVPGSRVNSLLKDEQDLLWIGTSRGVCVLDSSGSLVAHYLDDLSDEESKIKKLRFLDGDVLAVARSLYRFEDFEMKQFKLSANDVLRKGDLIFFAGSNSTSRVNYNKYLSFEEEQQRRKIGDIISNNLLLEKRSNVIISAADKIYLGTTTGLYVYEDDILSSLDLREEVLNTSILDLNYNASRNELWIATNSKGVVVLEDDKLKYHFTSVNGLNSNTCYSLKELPAEGYFVGGNNGINLISISNGAPNVTDYSAFLNIPEEKVNSLELVGQHLYAGTDGGLISIPINDVKAAESIPGFAVEEILVNGHSNKELLKLKHWENNITIGFTGISPKDYGNVIYEYKINDEGNWNQAFGKRLEFKRLAYGDYKVSLRAKGTNGLSSEPQIITFSIEPPFWKTLPFLVGLGLLIFLLIIWVVNYVLKKMRAQYDKENKRLQTEQDKAKLEKKMIELEQKALRLQMNPHFIFNTLNTIKGYYSGGEIKDANLYISRFSKLLRMILENDEHLVPLDKEVEMLELYIKLIQLRYENVFDYAINIDSEVKKEDIGIPPLLVQPLVENAIIHGLAPKGEKGRLEINFRKGKEDSLICEVIDNGVGFSDHKKDNPEGYQSKALQITKDRIRFVSNSEHNGYLKINSPAEDGGTEVIVELPILNLW